MKHNPTDDWTVVSDRYEVQSTEELQSISQAFGIRKKEQFAFRTNPMIDSPETKPTIRVTLSIWFWRDPVVRYYYQSTNLYKTWISHTYPYLFFWIPGILSEIPWPLFTRWFLDALSTISMSFKLLLWFDSFWSLSWFFVESGTLAVGLTEAEETELLLTF